MTQAKSLTLRKYGKQPVLGRDNSSINQMRPFFEQQIGMLDEAYELSRDMVRVVYDKAEMTRLMADVHGFRDSWLSSSIMTIRDMREQMKLFVGFLGRARALCYPHGGSVFIHERSSPFSLWNVEQRYEKCPKRVRLAFTDRYISRSCVRVFVSPYRVGNSPIWTPSSTKFIDATTIEIVHPGFDAVVVRDTPLLTNADIDKIDNREEAHEAMRQIHHCTMEIGFLMSRISSKAASDSNVVEKIVYRDRVVEVPKEVIKEVVREVPVEKIVERIVHVAGETREIQVPERFPAITQVVRWNDLPVDSNIFYLTSAPRPGASASGSGVMTKKGANGRAVPAENVRLPERIDRDRIVLSWLYREQDAGQANFPVYPVAIQGATVGAGNTVRFSIEESIVNPINWRWQDLGNVNVGGVTVPAPPPPVQPPPPPPTVPNANRCSPLTRRDGQDFSLKSLIAEFSTGNNEGPVKGWDGRIAGAQSNGSSGQGGGAAVTMGNMMRLTWNDGWMLDPWRIWARENGRDQNNNVAWAISQRFNLFQSWGVFMEMQDNRDGDENMWAEVRNSSIWVLYKGSDTYERVAFDRMSQQSWCEHFAPNMGTSLVGGNEFPPGSGRHHSLPMDSRPVAGGGVAFRVRPGFPWAVPHFAGASTRWTRPDDIDSILIAYEARLAPGSEHAKIGMHVGADPKIHGNNSADRTVWYPGFGLSKVVRLTPEWRLYAFTPMQRQNGSVRDGSPSRAIPYNRFIQACLPMGDTYPSTIPANAPAGSGSPAPNPPAGSGQGGSSQPSGFAFRAAPKSDYITAMPDYGGPKSVVKDINGAPLSRPSYHILLDKHPLAISAVEGSDPLIPTEGNALTVTCNRVEKEIDRTFIRILREQTTRRGNYEEGVMMTGIGNEPGQVNRTGVAELDAVMRRPITTMKDAVIAGDWLITLVGRAGVSSATVWSAGNEQGDMYHQYDGSQIPSALMQACFVVYNGALPHVIGSQKSSNYQPGRSGQHVVVTANRGHTAFIAVNYDDQPVEFSIRASILPKNANWTRRHTQSLTISGRDELENTPQKFEVVMIQDEQNILITPNGSAVQIRIPANALTSGVF